MGSTGVTVVLQCGQLWEPSRSLQTCRLSRDSPRSERVCGSRHAVAERPEPCGVRCEAAEATRAQLGPLRGAVLSPAAHRHGQLVQRQVPRRSHKVPAVRHAGGCLEGGAQLSHATACLTAARYDFSHQHGSIPPPAMCVLTACHVCMCCARETNQAAEGTPTAGWQAFEAAIAERVAKLNHPAAPPATASLAPALPGTLYSCQSLSVMFSAVDGSITSLLHQQQSGGAPRQWAKPSSPLAQLRYQTFTLEDFDSFNRACALPHYMHRAARHRSRLTVVGVTMWLVQITLGVGLPVATFPRQAWTLQTQSMLHGT